MFSFLGRPRSGPRRRAYHRAYHRALGILIAVMLAGGLGFAGLPSASAAVTPGPLINHGGQIQATPRVYLVFWDWQSDPIGEGPYLQQFLASVGGSAWLNVVNQYGGGSQPGIYGGSWNDPVPIPGSPTDTDVGFQAGVAAQHFGVSGPNVQIVVITAPGHPVAAVAADSCGEHAFDGPSGVAYTDLPYLTDTTCVVGLNGSYPVPSLWSNRDNGCVVASFEAAFQANAGDLGTSNHGDWGFGMKGGTSPAITSVPSGYEIAFQANTGNLWTTGTADPGHDWALGMAAGTSPAITSLPAGGYQTAFRANTGNLWTAGTADVTDRGLTVAAGTSPSIAP